MTWALPYSQTDANPECFEYQLDMGDQVQYACVYGYTWIYTLYIYSICGYIDGQNIISGYVCKEETCGYQGTTLKIAMPAKIA